MGAQSSISIFRRFSNVSPWAWSKARLCFAIFFAIYFLHATLLGAKIKCHYNSLNKLSEIFPRAIVFEQTVSVELRSFFNSWGRGERVYINKREFCERSLLVSRVFPSFPSTSRKDSFINSLFFSLYVWFPLSLLPTDSKVVNKSAQFVLTLH